MRIYSYVIEHDLGFAPNPFEQVCTLACCKPRIRKHAKVGEYIIGTGAAKPKLQGRLSYWMRISEIISFDEFWLDTRFKRKRPFMRGSRVQRYGDNIYHRDPITGSYIQEHSFHSELDGSLSKANLKRDTGHTERVLLATDFAYWGKSGPVIPQSLNDFIVKGTGHKCRFQPARVDALLAWLKCFPERGFVGEPGHWQFLPAQEARLAERLMKASK